MITFIAVFLLTNIVFSIIIYAALNKFNHNSEFCHKELLLYSIGIGPALTTLLLYYLFLFLPHRSTLFYLISIIIVYSMLALVGRKHITELCTGVVNKIKIGPNYLKNVLKSSNIIVLSMSLLCITFLSYILFLFLRNRLQYPLYGHDVLDHGIMGKILFAEKSLEPIWVRDFAGNSFLYLSKHAPSFSLLLTWEKIVSSVFAAGGDLYFKSISTYYGLLILGIQFYWLSRKNIYLAILGAFALLSGLSFFFTLTTYHLDSYRIFFLSISWIFLAYALKEKDIFAVLVLGIFSGLAAFAHSVGMVLVVFNCLAILLFLGEDFKKRLLKTGIVALLITVFGGIHYMIDTFCGRGWIF